MTLEELVNQITQSDEGITYEMMLELPGIIKSLPGVKDCYFILSVERNDIVSSQRFNSYADIEGFESSRYIEPDDEQIIIELSDIVEFDHKISTKDKFLLFGMLGYMGVIQGGVVESVHVKIETEHHYDKGVLDSKLIISWHNDYSS